MSKHTEITKAGVYGWLTCPELPNHAFFVKAGSEDQGKSEGTILTNGEKIALSSNMLAIVTGGDDENDSIEAVRRELREELNIDPDSAKIINGLPNVIVHQRRDGQDVRFDVKGYQIEVPWEILRQLTQRQTVIAVPNQELVDYLSANPTRPAVFLIARRMERKRWLE